MEASSASPTSLQAASADATSPQVLHTSSSEHFQCRSDQQNHILGLESSCELKKDVLVDERFRLGLDADPRLSSTTSSTDLRRNVDSSPSSSTTPTNCWSASSRARWRPASSLQQQQQQQQQPRLHPSHPHPSQYSRQQHRQFGRQKSLLSPHFDGRMTMMRRILVSVFLVLFPSKSFGLPPLPVAIAPEGKTSIFCGRGGEGEWWKVGRRNRGVGGG